MKLIAQIIAGILGSILILIVTAVALDNYTKSTAKSHLYSLCIDGEKSTAHCEKWK